MKTKFIIVTAIIFVLNGKAFGQYCTTDNRYTEVQFFDSTKIIRGGDIQYGIAQDWQGNPDILLMDIYYPHLTVDVSPKRPFIMMFHGGAFQAGDKRQGDIVDVCLELAKRGFVCASVGYRLGNDNSEYSDYKARYRAMQDGHAAMRYIVKNAATLRIDTSWIFVGGQSAGSVLSQGMVYADQSELDSISLLFDTTAISVELGGLFTSGNTLTDTYSIKGIFNNWGGVLSNEIDIDEMVPTIAFHGALDTIVLIDEKSYTHLTMYGSRKMYHDFVANNVCYELTVDPTGEHGIYRGPEESKFRAQRASCFFKSIFCNSCSDFYATETIPSNCSSNVTSDGNHYESNIIKVYPNPFENSFSIQGIDGTLDITIYNCFGQLVYKDKVFNGIVQTDLIPGLYFLKIKQVDSIKSFTTKLIKN
jgi:alpha/beta hydrolase fold/Secretion system C-terminal sorting domain